MILADARAVADLIQFAERAHRLDPAGSISIAARGSLVLVSAAPLFAAGLNDESPTVIGIKILPLVEESDLEFTTEIPAVLDRLAFLKQRLADAQSNGLPNPELAMKAPPVVTHEVWTAITPPQSDWQLVGETQDAAVAEAARQGIAEIAEGTPQNAGELAVHQLRAKVWGRTLPELCGAPAGIAFGLDGFGFIAHRPGAQRQGRVRLFRNGRWWRASGAYGEVFVR